MVELRERNQLLEGELAKVARVGKREEMTFEEEVRTWRAFGSATSSRAMAISFWLFAVQMATLPSLESSSTVKTNCDRRERH
jgi:hypothetical protein